MAIVFWAAPTPRVDILDPVTPQRPQSPEFQPGKVWHPRGSTFSLDSRMLTSFICGHTWGFGFIVRWDLQTGGVVSTIEWDSSDKLTDINYSTNGKMVAVLSQHETSATISIYSVVTGVYLHAVDPLASSNPDPTLRAPYVYRIWAHGESIRFATPGPTGITIWEVGFAPGATPTQIETISIPYITIEMFFLNRRSQKDIRNTTFHPASCRLAFVGPEGTLLVWDARTSKPLLHLSGIGCHTFSADFRFLACNIGSEICLWKE